MREQEFDALRALLLSDEWRRLQALEAETGDLAAQARAHVDALQQQMAALATARADAEATAVAQQARADALQAALDALQAFVAAEADSLEPRLVQRISHILRTAVSQTPDEMATALGPVVGEAIRVQIRDERKSLIEALSPIILETVQKAIADRFREFQRNIDARLRQTFGPQGWRRTLAARLRGVSPAELTLRDALPFSIQEIFLIQHESGLLLSHLPVNDTETADSDLIGGMLTAIRDFAHDSFGDGDETDELDEIQYGDERIIIQSGQHAYLAVVIAGVESEGFRARLRTWLAELHIQHAPQLRDFAGDPRTLPPALPATMQELAAAVGGGGAATAPPMSRTQRRWLVGGAAAGMLLLALACFYLQFTLALLPVAFGTPTPTPSATPTSTATAVPTATATFTPTPTSTLSPTATPQPTLTPSPPPTATPTWTPPPTAAPTPALPDAVLNAPVWTRQQPDPDAPLDISLPVDTAVTILTEFGEWVQIAWETADGVQQGWVPSRWITINSVNE